MDDASAPGLGGVFISYRREETAYAAGWLYDRLVEHLGRGKVFKDIDSIQLGDDWVEVINAEVASCDVLLALIGDQWLTIADEQGRTRLDDPHDFVRLEIEAALTRNVRVIPILVEGARMPRTDELPASLSNLTRRQALELSPNSFDFDLGRLLTVLDRTLAQERPQPTVTEPAVTSTGARAVVATGDGPVVDVPDTELDADRKKRRLVLITAGAGAAVVAAGLIAAAIVSQDGSPGTDASGATTTVLQQRASTTPEQTVATSEPAGDAGPRLVAVPSEQLWTDTRITCAAGDVLHITADGTILHNKEDPTSAVGPDGLIDPSFHQYNVAGLPDANTASLIASLGGSAPQFIGHDGSYTCRAAGNLFLGINDRGVSNNSGSFSASVQRGTG